MPSIGQVISFYSFKGGVGRSMAVANIAALLSKSAGRVLVIDWDLEAPGLHKFFMSEDDSLKTSIQTSPGIVDLLSSATEKTQIDWRECVIKVQISPNLHLDLFVP